MKARKTLAMAAALTIAVLTMTACTSQDRPAQPPTVATNFAAGTTMAKLQGEGAMTIGTRFDQPLFSAMGKDKVPAGFDVEIATLIASKLGIPKNKITWVESTSATRNALVTDGKADLIVAGDPIDDTSKEKVAFAGPYFYSGQDLLVVTENGYGKRTRVPEYPVKGRPVLLLRSSPTRGRREPRGHPRAGGSAEEERVQHRKVHRRARDCQVRRHGRVGEFNGRLPRRPDLREGHRGDR